MHVDEDATEWSLKNDLVLLLKTGANNRDL
jgi:hypothetical protein